MSGRVGREPANVPARRPRNAAATKEAIVQSALIAFSRAGYDGVGLREIAREASVTAVLINRYFGSKEELFAATVELAFADDRLFRGDVATLAQRVAHAMVQKTEKEFEPVDPLSLILRSAPNVRATEILRRSVERHFERPLTNVMSGDALRVRTALFLAVIAGFQLMKGILGTAALVDAEESALSDRLAGLLQLLIDDAIYPQGKRKISSD